ncbi:MAG TPA: glycoside hydrolase family 3 C-terminal domain-containing protein [Candidatus Didemnitutus sp.]|jgi:beta-glucosidase
MRERTAAWAIVPTVLLATCGLPAESANPPPYLDPSRPIEARVDDLVGRLTLDEKASLMQNATPGVPRLGIPKYDWWSEALHGVANAGHATVFPQAIGLAATWDDPLIHEVASVIGIEARAKFNAVADTPEAGTHNHGLTFWSPNINIFRDPRWGRGQETYGEDPFLTARVGVAFVRGLQGDDPRYLQAAACAKHFAVHSGPESLRHGFDVAPPPADLHETYLPAFEALVREGRVEAVMTAYNSLYGQPCSINPLLYSLLDSWGFDGHVVSDCGSISDLRLSYHRASDNAVAEALAVKAGLCLRCGDEPSELANAVRHGYLNEAELDRSLGALLRTQFRLGFFDPPAQVPFNRILPSENDTPAHAATALRAARESIVLLKNDGVLPLQRKKLKRVAVIGPNADSTNALLGNYHGKPSAPVTILAGLKAALGNDVVVTYVHGCDHAAQAGRAVTVPNQNLSHGPDAGLKLELFDNLNLAGPPAEEQESSAARLGWIGPGRVDRTFSARWTGELAPFSDGDYELTLTAQGGARLYLGNTLILDAWSETGDITRSCHRRLSAGKKTPLRLEYRHSVGPARMVLQWVGPDPAAGFADAIAAAEQSDVVIFAGGISAELEGEEMPVEYDGFSGGDRTRIELPAVQEKLLQKLQATGKPIVFVNLSGSAMAMPWEDSHLNAIVQAWYPGQAAGTAVSDVLLGSTNPAGRLPITFYRATGDLPAFEDYRMAGRTYRYFSGQPLYPFGHGLSYTRFNYADLRVTATASRNLAVSVEVTNAGERDGDEVVQLYATPPAESHPRETESLCAFRRVHFRAGETRTIDFIISAASLRRWNAERGAMEIPAGLWKIRAGASSADIRESATVRLDATGPATPSDSSSAPSDTHSSPDPL